MAVSEATRRLRDEVAAWMESRFMDRMASYAREGRRHAAMDGAALQAAWMQAVRAMAEKVGSSSARDRRHDLEAEYRLRGEVPPLALVAGDLALHAARAEAMLVDLVRNDPEGRAALEAHLARDLDVGAERRS